MERNYDDSIVILDKDQYATLHALATLGARESENKHRMRGIERHVAKFNAALTNFSATKHQEQRQARRREKELRRTLIRSHQGKIVYVEETVGTLTQFWLAGRDSSSRHQLRVWGWSFLERKTIHRSVDPSRIILEIPEDYVEFKLDGWRGSYVKKGTVWNDIAPEIAKP